MPYLHEVFKDSGVPTYTFVKPMEYRKLLVSLRTQGKGLVVEGPSGIGKTSSISKGLEELGIETKVTKLTARKAKELAIIKEIPHTEPEGIIIIDDFHRLDPETKNSIADYMKTLADEESSLTKLVIVGINKAGDSLVKFARDLNNRIDTIRFESNPVEKIIELIESGEKALNITINTKGDIVREAQGSFHIAQMLCKEICIHGDVLEAKENIFAITTSLEVIKQKVFEDLSRVFYETARAFATGPKLRKDGRAPYLHILFWLAISNEWALDLNQSIRKYPEHRSSVNTVMEQGYLESFLKGDKSELFADCIHFEANTNVISVEDPKFVYYIRNIQWKKFVLEIGYKTINFKSIYDFALSFAGSDRDVAEALFTCLREEEVSVFYDKNEQHRILAENVEEYLGPIYRSEAQYVIVLLGPNYPKRIWTQFESQQFKDRFGEGSVIPIWFNDAPVGLFDETSKIGGIDFDRNSNFETQIKYISEILMKKLSELRIATSAENTGSKNKIKDKREEDDQGVQLSFF
ncbi:TIR domain-containing protein [Paenibacillus sp. GCM10027628]|uniref:TIR domain-containing protein n=1 Tax=Paenibacillus sp. GCM10027628 TaxID=3273413 RepID=UPI00362B8F68